MKEAKKILRKQADQDQALLDEEYKKIMAPIEVEKLKVAKELTILKARLYQAFEQDFRGFAIIYARLHKVNEQDESQEGQ